MVKSTLLATFLLAALSFDGVNARCRPRPSSSSTSVTAAPTCAANSDNTIANPSFDDTTEVDGVLSYTGSPWTFSDATAEVRVQDDTAKAHSGSAFA